MYSSSVNQLPKTSSSFNSASSTGGGNELAALFAKRRKAWASEIIPGQLWLGSGEQASRLEDLQSRNITLVVNVADDVPNFHEGQGITYLNLNVVDFGQDQGISRVFPEAFTFLQEAKDSGKKVLVHCAAGANRSATLVLAWLMKSENLTLQGSWQHVKAKRPGIVPLKDNRKELLNFERQLYEGRSSFDSDEKFFDLK